MKKKQTRMTKKRFDQLADIAVTLRDGGMLAELIHEIQALKDDIKRLESAHDAHVKEMEWP